VHDAKTWGEFRLRERQLAARNWRHGRLQDTFAWNGLYLCERQLAPAERWHVWDLQNRQALGQLGLRQRQLASAMDGAPDQLLHHTKAGDEFRVREWQLAAGRRWYRRQQYVHDNQTRFDMDLRERQLAPALVLSRANAPYEMTARAA